MNETPETMARLQEIIDRSATTAGAGIRAHLLGEGWTMSAEEFVRFWGEGRMASIATVSAKGSLHAAPLDIWLEDGVFHVPTYVDAIRLQDHHANPRCVITSWEDAYRVAIVYGMAKAGKGSEVVDVEVSPTRIYAIMPPAGHPAFRQNTEGQRV
jgi:hypothetical protein